MSQCVTLKLIEIAFTKTAVAYHVCRLQISMPATLRGKGEKRCPPARSYRQTSLPDVWRSVEQERSTVGSAGPYWDETAVAAGAGTSNACSAFPALAAPLPSATDAEKFHMKLEEHRSRYFPGIAAFTEQQYRSIKAGCEMIRQDLLIVMPTGGGKSVIFQCAALQCRGVTVVISPLLSLMDDQLSSLAALESKVGCWTGRLGRKLRRQLEDDLAKTTLQGGPATKLLYMAPESAMGERGDALLHVLAKNRMLARLVVDEAHCVGRVPSLCAYRLPPE